MPPRKENEKKLAENIRSRNVEVVFQCWERNVTVYLKLVISRTFIYQGPGSAPTFCSMYSCPTFTALWPI